MSMAEKRLTEEDSEQPAKKHRFNGSSNSSKRQGQGVDATYGQRWAFGDLDTATAPKNDGLEWEDESDALAYLKSVRQQASGIPHVLIARKAGPELPAGGNGDAVDRSIYEDGKGDFRGYYHDGAYTAYPDNYEGEYEDEEDWAGGEGEEAGDRQEDELDSSDVYSEDASSAGPHNSNSAEIHEAYYITLANQYQLLRNRLQTDPPARAVTALPSANPTEVGVFGPSSNTFEEWSRRLWRTDPLPAQVASMHKDGIIRLLRIILGGKFFRKGHRLHERTSRWIWALLARLPEKGELDYQEVGWIRELGKRAILFMLSLAEAEVLHEQYGVGEGGSGSEHGAEVDIKEGVDEELSQHDDSEEIDIPEQTQVLDSTKDKLRDASSPPKIAADRGPNAHVPQDTENKQPGESDDVLSTASDVEMQIDSDEEEGEVSLEPPPQTQSSADVEAARARLLAQLEDDRVEEPPEASKGGETASSPPREEPGETPAEKQSEATRDEVNLRATLNMILTVAGEFYGQRDLLEFRDPFRRVD